MCTATVSDSPAVAPTISRSPQDILNFLVLGEITLLACLFILGSMEIFAN